MLQKYKTKKKKKTNDQDKEGGEMRLDGANIVFNVICKDNGPTRNEN